MSEDMERLPKWAQRRIEKLEQDVASYRRQLAVGPEDSNVFRDPYSDGPDGEHLLNGRPIGKDTTIRFTAAGGWIECKVTDRGLSVRSEEALWVQTQSGNSAVVRNGPWSFPA